MSLDAIVKMRLGREQHAIYEAEAAARGLPLTTWLRQRLDAADQLHAQLDHILTLPASTLRSLSR